MSFDCPVEHELKKIYNLYKSEILRMEFKTNALINKTMEINALLNEDNINKLKKVNKVDVNDTVMVQNILSESPSIKLLSEYLDEIKRELKYVTIELETKKSFYERIKKHIYATCEHLWISDHFENLALMTMVGCTYCNVCGMTRDDI